MMARFVFVADTDTFAGGFERELCGYLTGRLDEPSSHHGETEAEIAEGELPEAVRDYFEEHVILCPEQPDDLPISTPVIIYPTPGWWNDGRGNYTKGIPTAEDLAKCWKGKAWPAHYSVGILFDERPPADVIGILKARAKAFAEYWPGRPLGCPFVITGFRLVEETVRTIEEEV